MTLSSLFLAVLAACGGGNGVASTDATAALDTNPATALDTSTMSTAERVRRSPQPVPVSMPVSSTPVTSTPVASAPAAPAPVASSPAPAPTAPTSTPLSANTTLAVENKSFSVDGPSTVRYGVGDRWVLKVVSGTVPCTNTFFGSDPAYGIVKSCQFVGAGQVIAGPVVVPGPAPAPAPAPAPVVAAAPAPAPSPTPAPAPAPAPVTTASVKSLMPAIDTSKIPTPATPATTAKVSYINAAAPGQQPTPDIIGAFREYCEFSHMSFDDPIVYPGQKGVSHLHTFMGNSGITSDSTVQSVANSGGSTCAGGTLNRTGYWFPAVIDTKDGTPMAPVGSLIYYKTGYHYVDSAAVKPIPAGLRMIAGNSASTQPQDGGVARFICIGPGGDGVWRSEMPAVCPAGAQVLIDVEFPQCWDGVNLDSPDHKSHMAYANIGCPADHPVPLPVVSFEIRYEVTDSAQTARWRLSSDNYDKSLPGGYSTHGDYFMGWDQAIMNTFVTRCINAKLDCHAYLLGDGRILN